MAQWNRVPLIDYIELIGGGTPKTTVPEYWNGNIPWLSVKDFNNDKRYVYSTEKHISQSGFENSPTKMLHKDDIIISARGTVGEIAMIPFDMAFNQSCYGIRASRGIGKPFLYYLLKNCISQLKRMTHGSVFDTITRDTFANIEVDIPDAETQKRISSVLADIDNKIEVNDAINDNLQQQAAAIFRSWFVDYAPFGGTAPNEWKNVTLEEITALVSRGITPKYADDADQIVINQKCIRNHMIDLSLARSHKPKVINDKWLRFGDLLINSTGDGTLGRVAQVWFQPHNLTVDSHVTIVRPAAENTIFYIGLWGIQHEKEIESLHTGSTGQTELPRDRVKALELLLPDKETLDRFNALIAPMAADIISNQEENNRLASIRDALLPKLMSGKIDVSGIQL